VGAPFRPGTAGCWKMSLAISPAKPASARSCSSNRIIFVLPPDAPAMSLTFSPARVVHRGRQGASHERGPGDGILRACPRSSPHQAQGMVGAKAKAALEKEFNLKFPPTRKKQLGETLGATLATINLRTSSVSCPGMRPRNCRKPSGPSRARKKCIALVYEGVNAVAKIRDVLGRPIRPRRRPAPSAANSARPSWSTPPTPVTRRKMPGGKWASST